MGNPSAVAHDVKDEEEIKGRIYHRILYEICRENKVRKERAELKYCRPGDPDRVENGWVAMAKDLQGIISAISTSM